MSATLQSIYGINLVGTIEALKDVMPPGEGEVWIDYLYRARLSGLLTEAEVGDLMARFSMQMRSKVIWPARQKNLTTERL